MKTQLKHQLGEGNLGGWEACSRCREHAKSMTSKCCCVFSGWNTWSQYLSDLKEEKTLL